MWLVLLVVFLSGCTVVIKDREAVPQRERERATGPLRAYCPSKIETVGFYCKGNRAYSNLVQAGSRVRVYSQSTRKSITIAIYRRDDINGVCVPERFEPLLGKAPFRAVLEVERCGVDGNTVCPPVIRGMASWYGEPYHGRETPYGIIFDKEGMYAAHRELPLGTLLRVRNLKNGREVEVKVIDRGPFKEGRVLDLSEGAARKLGMIRDGVVPVEAVVLRCGD
jgi:rare lipoprotein A